MASDYYDVADWETRLESLVHSVGLVIVAFLLSTACAVVGLSLFAVGGTPVESTDSLAPLPYAALTAIQFLGFFLAAFGYLRWRGDPDLFDVDRPSASTVGWIVGGFVALYALNLALGAVFAWLGLESATNQAIEAGRRDPARFLYMVPVTLLFVAPAEELLFRGVVQGLFRRAYGVVPGIVFASVVFGFGHWLALIGGGEGKLVYVAVTAALGLLLGALYELSGNLVVPIVVHGLYNTLVFLNQYVQATDVAL